MGFKPDEVYVRADGVQVQVRYRRSLGADGGWSFMIRIVEPDGTDRGFWHCVWLDDELIHFHGQGGEA